ncbi:restriction endonuclease subunit S [Cytobacillus firmus]|uniref:restriction endonuclease subunit S n=1 Tax=Cytobacillus firmus TaxID=1399 RepID=UPI0020403FDD|nr:restriction endonuclease subunit S [Cytobacillus firmus]MCM3706425.1 restriction endonuclease subunit S [Cytobacillus firmus]
MSKKKKTIEELLKETLVSQEEQPYEVPKNWVWTRVENAIKPMETRDPKRLDGEVFHYIDVDAIDNKKQSVRQVKEVEITLAPSRAKRKVSKNDVIISLVRPYLKNIAHIDIDDNKLVVSTAFYVCTPKEILNSNFLYSYLCSNYVTQYLIDHTRGDNSPSVRSTDYERMPLPLPPVNEQKRIVEKVERLLSKLEEAKLLIKEAKGTFKLRRAAILDKAFRGEITDSAGVLNQIDEQPYVIPDKWEWKRFKDVAHVCSNLVEPKQYLNLPHIAPDNIEKGTGRLLDYQTIEESKVKSPKHYFYRGQILYSKIRPYLSKVTLAEFDGLCSADMYPIETNIDIKYLYWYMLSPFFVEKASTAGSRSVLPKINQKELSSIPVPVPPIETQREIVSFIERTLSQENHTIGFVDNAIEIMEKLEQSILSKAFRGELETNNPSDEIAIELLKEVLQEQVK